MTVPNPDNLLRVTLSSIGDAVITTDARARVTFLNPVAERLTGWRLVEASGQPLEAVFRIVNERTRQPGENSAARVLRDGVVMGLANHTVLIARDGTERPIDDSAAPIRDDDGGLVGVVLVFRDVTQRRQAEEALRQSEQQLQRLADSVPALISYVDADGCYRLNNRTYETWFGRPRGELAGKHMREVLGDRAWEAIRPHVETALAGKVSRYEREVPYRTGGTRWISATYTPDFAPQGAVRGFVVHVNDITDRKRSEEAVRAGEERYRSLFASIDEGFCVCEAVFNEVGKPVDYRFLDINPSFERLTGISADEALKGRTARELIPDLEDFWIETYGQVVLTGEPVRFVNGSEAMGRWFDVYAARVEGENSRKFTLVFNDITERKRAEATLRESEQRFRVMADTAPAMLWVTEPDLSCTFRSRGWYEYTGQTEATGLGLGWFDVVHPDDCQVSGETFRAANGKHAPFALDHRVRRADGEYRWMIDAGQPRFGGDGEFLGYIGSVIDIHDRKQAEEALRDVRSRMEAALAAGAIATWSWDLETDRVYADENLARMFSLSPEDAAGVPVERYVQAIHLEDRAQVTAAIDRALSPGERDFEVDYRIVSPDGSVRWVIARGRVERDAAGRPLRMPGLIMDITDRKQAEVALQETEERYRTLFSSIDEGFCIIEVLFDDAADSRDAKPLDYRFAEVNPAFEKQTGIENAVGRRMREIAPAHEEHWFEIYGEVALTGEPVRFQSCAEALHRWYDVYAFRVGEPQQRRVAILFNDITERKRAEEALHQSDRRKDDFLATLAHELRNPLAPLRTSLELMRLAPDDETVVEQARGTMERQVRHMVRLIDDLLDISRITRGKIRLQKSRVALATVIQDAVETVRPLIQESQHSLEVTLPSAPIYVQADAARLAQVLSNLLNNAIKYTNLGGRIWLTSAREETEAVITVRDTGIGIPPDMLDGIFEMFIQVDRSLERSRSGLGIGLSLAKRLVELHGGAIKARSPGAGQGSEFIVRLPLPAGSDDDAKSPPLENEALNPGARRILVVDDNRDAADALGTMLKILGNAVCIAFDGEQALAQAASFRPDVVLLDLRMPRVDGHETARRLRQQSWGADLVLIALTGYGQDEDRQRTLEAGFDHHLVKPVEPAALQKLLSEMRPANAISNLGARTYPGIRNDSQRH